MGRLNKIIWSTKCYLKSNMYCIILCSQNCVCLWPFVGDAWASVVAMTKCRSCINYKSTIWRKKCHNEYSFPGLILGLRPPNERRRYFVTMSLIGWAQALNQACLFNVLQPVICPPARYSPIGWFGGEQMNFDILDVNIMMIWHCNIFHTNCWILLMEGH